MLGSLVGGLSVYRQHQVLQAEIQHQKRQMQEMAALLASVQQSDPEPLMRSMLEEVGAELKRRPGRTLADTTISRIAALAYSFQPYKYMQGDSLSEKSYSPGRGQLLQALVLMNIDSGSFVRIKRLTLFAGADLRGIDLKGLNLSGINLQKANLEGADLHGANLQNADLEEANLWGVNLNQTNLRQTNLKNADLTWAQLNEAKLTLANLNGANLRNAQLIKADLSNATLQFAQSAGALFNEAILTSVDFAGTNLTKVNFSQANLDDADLRGINLSEADLIGVQLNKALVDKNWLDKLKEWQPTGAQEMQQNYNVVNDTFSRWKRPIYRLIKIKLLPAQ